MKGEIEMEEIRNKICERATQEIEMPGRGLYQLCEEKECPHNIGMPFANGLACSCIAYKNKMEEDYKKNHPPCYKYDGGWK